MSAVLPPDPTLPLSVALRDGSSAEHRAAEASPFVVALLAGRVHESGYVAYLERLRPIYATLETAGRNVADHPMGAAVHDPALERLPSLEDDLEYWSDRVGKPVASGATGCAYVDRLRASTTWPGLFVAHHYTRYLGDLSGGQAFAAALRREYGVTGGRGLSFYTFEHVPKPKLYKDAYRERLDALDLDGQQRQRIVDEVRTAFRLNRQLFADLTRELSPWERLPRG